MIDVDWSLCSTTPKQHQKEGVHVLCTPTEPHLGRTVPNVFLLADEVGCGKSKQVVDAAHVLHQRAGLELVIVLAPAFARRVWASPNPIIGEVAKHSWPSVPYALRQYSVLDPDLGKHKNLTSNVPLEQLATGKPFIRWLISNYEFMRRKERLGALLAYAAKRRFWLVCDEAWSLTHHTTAQFKATEKLRQYATWVTLLNGSSDDSPLGLYAQFRLMDRSILETRIRQKSGRMGWSGFTPFRARYAILKPNVSFPLILDWQNLEELREKTAPYILKRKTRDSWNLPPVLPAIKIHAPLDDDSWRLYKEMRDEMVAWLKGKDGKLEVSMANQAIVKTLRLLQITSGFIGGVQESNLSAKDDELADDPFALDFEPGEEAEKVVKEIGRAKLDALMDWFSRLQPDPERTLIWCHFRKEIERTAADFERAFNRPMYLLYGQQKEREREAAIEALNPDFTPPTKVGVVGQPQAGGAALNFSGCALAIRLSRAGSLRVFRQAAGRIERPGQRNPMQFVDVVATGPKGQKTIDHHILEGLMNDIEIANWLSATWRTKLMEE